MVSGKLVDEHNRESLTRCFVIQFHAVVSIYVRHNVVPARQKSSPVHSSSRFKPGAKVLPFLLIDTR